MLPSQGRFRSVCDVGRARLADTLRVLNRSVLDNSLRETSVAAIRNHTLDEKWAIMRLVTYINQFCNGMGSGRIGRGNAGQGKATELGNWTKNGVHARARGRPLRQAPSRSDR
jgi:hypothetical protein